MQPTRLNKSITSSISAQDPSVSSQLHDFLIAHTNYLWGSGVEAFDSKLNCDHPVHRNTKKNLVEKFVFGHKVQPSVLTLKDVERHLEGSEKFYFTGSKSAEDVLVYLDVDCHEGWQDDPDFAVALLRSLLPNLYVCTSTRGRNGYLLLRRTNSTGYHAPARHVNGSLRLLEVSLRKLFLHHKVKTAIEVKGHVQHIKGGSYYCGKLAKLPNFGGMSLGQMDALRNTSRITISVIKQFAAWVDSVTGFTDSAVRAYYKDVRKSKDQPPPMPCRGVDGGTGGSVEVKPRTSATRLKTATAGDTAGCRHTTGDSFETGLQVCLDLARKMGRVPTTEEALDKLRVNGLFTGMWEENEAKRAGRIAYNLDYISRTFDPTKLARSPALDLAALDLTEHVGWVERRYPDGIGCATVEDVNTFLAITKFCLVVDPNENGSLPFERFKTIWQRLYAAGLLQRQFRWDRWRQIRDRLKSEGVVEVFGKPERRTAQKWRIGLNFPDYDRLSSVFEGLPTITAPFSGAKEGREGGGSDLTLCLQHETVRFHLSADKASELVHVATFGCRSLEGEREEEVT